MKNSNLKIIIFFFIIFAVSAIFADNPEIRITPQPLVKGRNAQLNITSTEAIPELLKIPEVDGIKWLSGSQQSSRTEIINFKATTQHSISYSFLVEKDGDINFPSFKLQIGNAKIASNPFTLKAISPKIQASSSSSSSSDGPSSSDNNENESLDKFIFMKAFTLSDRDEFYVGEEIPFEIAVFCASGIRAEYSWPEINAQNIVFKDFSQINKENAKFAGYNTATENNNGRTFNTYRFTTVFRAIAPEILVGDINLRSRIYLPRSREKRRNQTKFNDAFFDSFFDDAFSNYEKIEYPLSCKMPKLKINPLPEKPTDTKFTGLVGDWKLSLELSSDKFKVGESFTLKINADGNGGTDNLIVPELPIKGFRIYPHETRKLSSLTDINEKISIEYVIVPLEKGENYISLDLSTFSTSKKKYEKWKLEKNIIVEKGDGNLIPSTVISSEKNSIKTSQTAKNLEENRADILYLKKSAYGTITIPLWKNRLPLILIIFIIGPLALLISEIIILLSNKRSDSASLRKSAASKKRRKLAKKIATLEENSSDSFIRDEFCPWLNDMLGYPPGISAEEIVEKLENKELAMLIANSAKGTYIPSVTTKKIDDIKKILLNGMKRIASILLLFVVFFTYSTTVKAENDNSPSIVKNSPFELYDKGLFEEASLAFTEKLKKSPNDPYLLYNIGTSYYRAGKIVNALYFFEKAKLLAPRDSDIQENMNHTRRKLNLPEKGIAKSPSEIMVNFRDHIRPDEWLTLIAIFASCAFAIFAFRRKLSSEKTLILLSVFLLLCGVAIFAFTSQLAGDYANNFGMLMKRDATFFILPSENSAKAEISPIEGQELKIVEERSDWTRVRINNDEAWTRKDNVQKFF